MSSEQASDPERPGEFSKSYTRFALGLLLLVYIFNFVDRQIVAILLQSIKEDLDLSDTQLGFFSGTAFALFYSTLGIPIARWSDRNSRTKLIAGALLVWSAMTTLQGFAKSFAVLAAARVGVGVGEAGCSPPAHSMLADFFPVSKRATVFAVYALGIPIGSAIGYATGGWVAENVGWRAAFVVVGVPGIVLAAIVRRTLKEPTRGYWDNAAKVQEQEPVRVVARFLAGRRSFVHLAFAGALHAFIGYGAGAFNPAFYERLHDFSRAELGYVLGAVSLTAGVAGTFAGGWITDRLSKRDIRWYVWFPALTTVLSVPFLALFYLEPDRWTAVAWSLLPALLAGAYLGPTFALTQNMVPARWRSQASALLLLVLNLIGLGLGPQFVGWVSDMLAPEYGLESIRQALVWTTTIGAAWATIHYLLAARTLSVDLEAQYQLDDEKGEMA
ncbi:MAG: MFS transporter [Deltaproteobacteria bacterium]